jgi:hypothetical protein
VEGVRGHRRAVRARKRHQPGQREEVRSAQGEAVEPEEVVRPRVRHRSALRRHQQQQQADRRPPGAVADLADHGTTGGINRANFSFWRNQQTSGAKTTSVGDNLRASWRSVYNLCSNGVAGEHPKFIETDRATFEVYEGLLLANERFTSKETADGGFKNEVMKFKGAMVAYGPNPPSGFAYFMNPEFIKLAYQKGHWYKAGETVEPANQTVKVFKVHTICNLIVTNMRMLGVVNGCLS